VNTSTGAVMRALDATTGPIADPMVAIGNLRERLLGSIVSGDLARKVTIASAAPKYAAYLAYMEAARVFVRDQAASRPIVERAIALDPTFAGPYGLLATTYTNAAMFDSAEAVVARLATLKDRLSSYDRLLLEYHQMHNSGNAPEILRLAQEVYSRSADPVFAYLTGYWAIVLNKPATAIGALRLSQADQFAIGWTGQARDEAIAQHLAGNYRLELAALDTGTVRVPAGAAAYRNSRLRAYAGLHDTAAAYALADTLLRRQTDASATGPLNAVYNGAAEFDAHGDSLAGARLAGMVLDWAQAHVPKEPPLAWERVVGRAFLLAGRLDSALAHLQRALPDSSGNGIRVAGDIARIAARRGDTAKARAISDSLGDRRRKWDRGVTPLVQAGIAAELGERERAIQLLSTTTRVGQSMANWHSRLELRALRGFPAFEALIKPQK